MYGLPMWIIKFLIRMGKLNPSDVLNQQQISDLIEFAQHMFGGIV